MNRKQAPEKDKAMIRNLLKSSNVFFQTLGRLAEVAPPHQYRKLGNVFADEFEAHRKPK